MKKLLLAAGVIAILAVALLPYARDAWQSYRLERMEEERQRFIALKEREIACLERLAERGLRPGVGVEAEIDRCKRLAIDPETGDYAKQAR